VTDAPPLAEHTRHRRHTEHHTAAVPRSAFIPLSILAAALCAWFGFQTLQLVRERDALIGASAVQERQVQESKKLRGALDAIASGTAKLAEKGNANARLVVEELRRRGVTINPSATSPPGK
jgi:hypothetical protein